MNHYYKQNVYLSWEGAYRLYIGQLPYRDFGMPMGVGYWVIPAIFFKLFGPYLFTLVKAQFFVNLVFLFCFREILRFFKVPPTIRLISIFVLCISYIPLNYWPWYNNMVIFYEMLSLTMLFRAFEYKDSKSKHYSFLFACAIFTSAAIFTKQDGGGLTLVLNLALLSYFALSKKNLIPPIFYGLAMAVLVFLYFFVFRNYDIGYWFNYGQPPHFSRMNLHDFLKELYLKSKWIKFYAIISLFLFGYELSKNQSIDEDEKFRSHLFFIFTLGVLCEAFIYQVTSYNPPDSNYFFHAFAIAYLLGFAYKKIQLHTMWVTTIAIVSMTIIFSENYWNLSSSLLQKIFPKSMAPPSKGVVSIDNYFSDEEGAEKPYNWQKDNEFKSLKNITMPKEVLDGIRKMKALDVVKHKNDLQVLNLSELTFLAYELHYTPLRGQHQPLFYHVGVGEFDREVKYLENGVEEKAYDLILFETIEDWKDYYPSPVYKKITENYQRIDKFRGPKGFPRTYIEVFVKPSKNSD